MSERPILFSDEMVCAILEGRKTQTRRPLDFSRLTHIRRGRLFYSAVFQSWAIAETDNGHEFMELVKCPYGAPGDRLWVREAHQIAVINLDNDYDHETGSNLRVIYRATDQLEELSSVDDQEEWAKVRCRPSIHMPRWASRLTLEITDVRVQRVQEMSEEDAEAEGIHRIHHGDGAYYYHWQRTDPHPKNWCHADGAFRALWDSINAKRGYSFDSNPWVWAITFKRVEK